MSEEEFTRLSAEVFKEMNKITIANERKLRSGTISLQEFQFSIMQTMSQHRLFPILEAAMSSNESFRQKFQVMAVQGGTMFGKKGPKKEEKNKEENNDKLEELCHRVYKDSCDVILKEIKDLDESEWTVHHYQGLLSEQIYKHKDIAQLLKIVEGSEKKCGIYMSLLTKHATSLMEKHKKICKLNKEKKNAPKQLPKEGEKKKSKENGCEECSTKVEELANYKKIVEDSLQKMKEVARNLKSEKENSKVLAENLETEKKKLENMNKEKATWKTCLVNLKNEKEKCETLKKEKENLEKKLEKTEKTMAENMKKEKENSEKLAKNLKMEKENFEDSLKWFRNELEKSENLVENLQEKRENEKKEHEQMASKMAEMEEFQRINNKETEEWKAQIMKMFEKQAEELKIAKQELKKYQSKK